MRPIFRFVALISLIAACAPPNFRSQAQTPATVGQWSAPVTWPYLAVHAHVLPSGKVLWWPSFDNGDNPTQWDPATGVNTALPHLGANVFCAGHSFLADGQLFVAGGHILNWFGLPDAYTYNSSNGTWTRLPDMNNGRWYPTNTTLANGDVLVVSGWVDTSSRCQCRASGMADSYRLLAEPQRRPSRTTFLPVHVWCAQWQGVLRRTCPALPVFKRFWHWSLELGGE